MGRGDKVERMGEKTSLGKDEHYDSRGIAGRARIISELLAIMREMMATNTLQMGSLPKAYGMEPILNDFLRNWCKIYSNHLSAGFFS